MGTGGNSRPDGEGSGNDTIIFCIIFFFVSQTVIEVFDKDKLVKKKVCLIKEGDLVQTYNGNSKALTKVIKIVKNKGTFEFYEFKCRCRDNASNEKSISVTGNHTMIIFGKQKDEVKFKNASQVKVGDLLRTTEGIFEIFEINKKNMEECFEIRTEDGTVLANDILVSTLYLEKNVNEKKYQKILDLSKIPIEILN